MNLRMSFVVCSLAVGLSGEAAAQACNHQQSIAVLSTLLQAKTVCAALAADRWQEYHATGGALFDWKRGPGHPVDPREQVGTWSITSVTVGNTTREQVTHAYTGGSSFRYRVCLVGATYTFQQVSPGSTTITGATILSGSVACP